MRRKRPLKEYEIDIDVIDLEAYIDYHVNGFVPLNLTFTPEDLLNEEELDDDFVVVFTGDDDFMFEDDDIT